MTDFGRELLTSTIYQERACLLAFDEAHCIVEWYVMGFLLILLSFLVLLVRKSMYMYYRRF